MQFRSFLGSAGVIGATFAVGATAALAGPREFATPQLGIAYGGAQDKAASKPANGKEAKPADKAAEKPAAKSDKPADKPADKQAAKPAETKESSKTTTTTTESSSEYGFGGLGDFWNVREANSNLKAGQWNFETTWGWSTNSDGSDDDVFGAFALRYGISDDIFAEFQVYPLNLGDGDNQGNGDLGIILFWTPVRETETMPAFGTYGKMRIPSGDGSSKVDGEWHWIVTKTLMPKFRMHMEGFIQTANGGRSDAQDDGRRPFQWGVGPGFDYQIAEKTKAVLNYLNRSSDQIGNQNTNVLEIGIAQGIGENQYVCVGVDIGLDDGAETNNFLVKAQYGITWK